MKAALRDYLRCEGGEGVKAMLMGTREGDPNGSESDFAPYSGRDGYSSTFQPSHDLSDWGMATRSCITYYVYPSLLV